MLRGGITESNMNLRKILPCENLVIQELVWEGITITNNLWKGHMLNRLEIDCAKKFRWDVTACPEHWRSCNFLFMITAWSKYWKIIGRLFEAIAVVVVLHRSKSESIQSMNVWVYEWLAYWQWAVREDHHYVIKMRRILDFKCSRNKR